jgi:hypothetical protein
LNDGDVNNIRRLKANKFDEAIATLTTIIKNAQGTLHINGVNEIIKKQFVQSILKYLNNILDFSRVHSNLKPAKFIEELESENYSHCGEDLVDVYGDEL